MTKKSLYGLIALFVAVLFTAGVCLFTLSATVYEDRSVVTVVLDAGHGGIDGGVSGRVSRIKESDLNLAIVQKLQMELESLGMDVVLTRKTQAGLYGAATKGFKRRDMEARKKIIASASPQAVISVHQNFFSLSSKRGATVFFKPSDERGILLASSLQNALNGSGATPANRQPLAGDYYMLNCSSYPSVIVECGFLSNAEDEALLISEEYQSELCRLIAEGLIAFFAKA